MNSNVESSTPRTMKLERKIGEQEIVILIDCGTTHNFISHKLVEFMKLSSTKTMNYGVVMGLGEAIKGKGVCNVVMVALLEMIINEDFLPLELANLDLSRHAMVAL